MKILYDWTNAPPWANWAARDSNGFAHWFEMLPQPSFNGHSVEWLKQKETKECSSCNPFWLDRLDTPDAHSSLEDRKTPTEIAQSTMARELINKFFNNFKGSYSEYKIESEYIELCDKLRKITKSIPLDPLYPYLGKKILVVRENGNVVVSIFRNKKDNTYSFINITKSHVCTCKFDNIIDAFVDLDEQQNNGKVVSWRFID